MAPTTGAVVVRTSDPLPMFALPQFQVLNPIVVADSIEMMDSLVAFKRSPKMLSHYQTVLRNAAFAVGHRMVFPDVLHQVSPAHGVHATVPAFQSAGSNSLLPGASLDAGDASTVTAQAGGGMTLEKPSPDNGRVHDVGPLATSTFAQAARNLFRSRPVRPGRVTGEQTQSLHRRFTAPAHALFSGHEFGPLYVNAT